MKTVNLLGEGNVVVRDVAEPQIKEADDVKIRVRCASICADDLQHFLGRKTDIYIGHSVGHEFSGEIVDVGREAAKNGFAPGMRVSGYSWLYCGKCPYCRSGKENLCVNISGYTGTMAEYVVLKDRQVLELPPDVSMESGCFVELVSGCLRGIDNADLRAGRSLLVIGAGGAGLILTQLARLQGMVRLTVSEPVESKRMLAKKLGADYVIDPNAENLSERTASITDYLGYDYILDASHDEKIVNELLSLLAKNGTLMLFSRHAIANNISVNLSEFYVKECTIKTAYMAPYMLPRSMEILHRLDLESLVGKTFTLDEAQAAFEAYATGLYPRVMIRIA